MASNTLTLALLGDVDLNSYAEAIGHFRSLVQALTDELAHGVAIEWSIQDLSASSAIATIRGESDQITFVENIVHGYVEVGKALARNTPIPYPEKVAKEAQAITRVLYRKVSSIRFETPDEDITISTPFGVLPDEAHPYRAFGAVRGRVETLTRRKGLRFVLYEALSDRAVSCYVKEDQEELMRDIWGKRVAVEGLVSRDPLTGLPFTVRNVSNVVPLGEIEPGGYQQARGAVPIEKGMIPPEEAIRRIRDA